MALRRLGTVRTIALAVAVTLGLGFTPSSIKAAVGQGVLACSSALFRTVGTVAASPKSPADPLKEAILNVTTDYEELSHLLVDFMRSQPQVTREQFREFLAERATRSYPRLEGLLDWLLSIYKFAFPFLIISMAAKLSNGEQEHQEGGGHGEPLCSSPEPPALEQGAGGAAGAQLGLGGGGEPTAVLAGSVGRRASGQQDAGDPERLPGRVLSKTLSKGAGADRGVLAPSTPVERYNRSNLPPHPAQLQGGASQKSPRHHHREVLALVRPT